jgi:hypothetical protein
VTAPLIVRCVIVEEGERAHSFDEFLMVVRPDPTDTGRSLLADVERCRYMIVEQLDARFSKRVDT